MKIYEKKDTPKKMYVKIIGITVFKKLNDTNKIKKYFLGEMLKIIKKQQTTEFYILGIKLFTKRQYKSQIPTPVSEYIDISRRIERKCKDIFFNMQILSQVSYYHRQVFPPYKRKYENTSVVIVASGPTVHYYKYLHSYPHIAINGSVRCNNIPFDYVFLTDLLKANIETNDIIDAYPNAIKFYALLPNRRSIEIQQFPNSGRIPQHRIYESGAIPFILEDVWANKWAVELACEPFGDFGGSIFSALQFALYTNPQKIFLVGADCSNNYFYKTNFESDNSSKVKSFTRFKSFQELIYPNVEIISVNPVGLKGMFRDVYTASFLAEHPEIDRNSVEILNDEGEIK